MKILRLFFVLFVAFSLFGCSKKDDSKKVSSVPFHIGIVTGTYSQSEDDARGAEALLKLYGAVSDGGYIQHVTYPDNFPQEVETVISQISGLADDPLMKAIIVNQSVPGTTGAFQRVRARRPDILLIAGEAHEDPLIIKEVADLILNNDFLRRGYLLIHSAKELGLENFVHISFPRHMSYEVLSSRLAIMQAVGKDLGINVYTESSVDPISEVGIAGAQQFILEKVPAWIKQYGLKTNFFTTNDAQTEALIKQLVTYGGYFIEADLPSPIMGYPGALGIDLTAEKGNFQAITKKIEEALMAKKASGRFGTWVYSTGYISSLGLGDFIKNVLEGKAELLKTEDLKAFYEKHTPGANWRVSLYVDPTTGVVSRNHMLPYQDTYIFGKGYIRTSEVEVPEKYLSAHN